MGCGVFPHLPPPPLSRHLPQIPKCKGGIWRRKISKSKVRASVAQLEERATRRCAGRWFKSIHWLRQGLVTPAERGGFILSPPWFGVRFGLLRSVWRGRTSFQDCTKRMHRCPVPLSQDRVIPPIRSPVGGSFRESRARSGHRAVPTAGGRHGEGLTHTTKRRNQCLKYQAILQP